MATDQQKCAVAAALLIFVAVTFVGIVLIFAPRITRVPFAVQHVLKTKKLGKPTVSSAGSIAVYSVTYWVRHYTHEQLFKKLFKKNIYARFSI